MKRRNEKKIISKISNGMGLLSTILGIIFPSKCLVCGRDGTDLCLTCLSDFPGAERESARWIFPIFDYRYPPMKRAVWLLKYKGKKTIASVFAEVLYGRILEELSELSIMENFREPVLIPVPLSSKRYRERGFNQAELICRELIKINDLRHGLDLKLENNILIKIKDTEHQVKIENRKERMTNVVGSFSVRDESINQIKGRNIILLDDVATTGATLNEAKKILKHAGARKVIAFTIAH
ncbi:hypothetical protein A3A95_02120 [Candidatus Nomurabacteria bacterium RIFCSPLOWO2_01_FULL_39_18]|uniref:Phosphoribosyltransferase domain-containing protein n=1 Tax=Candidatus Nomurabacteria bacterium RIFCSPHIGHO2_01_FULL_40_24b TaxID=1801739 RepID=A0A1F6V9J5_9BACT|nr:MAG: hypothetical protein A2647_00595 [Candidatus Nomurabacteria bacterium RIFCSPHIGHO2_01_FULL_40_24b]OGI90660.1 MAG: hypothetical protein A3A95_02120 [Candidatus Nomurabacteria bacterium RIFCSPLOWO2_01_FULL_39_18]